MKRLIALLMLAALLLVGCSNESAAESKTETSKTSQSESKTASEEERKVWTETEQRGNTKITREYRDGKNDYTVTVETFADDILSEKTVREMKNSDILKETITTYSDDGSFLRENTFYYDDNSETIKSESVGWSDGIMIVDEYVATGAYLSKTIYCYDPENDYALSSHTFENITVDGVLIAEAREYADVIDGVEYNVTETTYYKNDSPEIHKKTVENADYYYAEYSDKDKTVIYCNEYESESGVARYAVYGENGFVVAENGTVFEVYELDGSPIAKIENGSITAIADGYPTGELMSNMLYEMALKLEALDSMELDFYPPVK